MIHFVNEAYRHCKTLAFTGEAAELLAKTSITLPAGIPGKKRHAGAPPEKGVIIAPEGMSRAVADEFVAAIAEHRHWKREIRDSVPA